jgi:Tfp pilus assembly protein PilF
MLNQQVPAKLGEFLRLSATIVAAIFLPLSLAVTCTAQGGGAVDFSGSGGIDSISGRIYFPSGRRSDAQIKVSLESSNAGTRIVFADGNGSFAFKNLEPGRYTVTIDGGKEYETTAEYVYIDDMRSRASAGPGPPPRNFSLPIYLQPKRATSPVYGAGVVDARLSEIPTSARDLYLEALEWEKRNNTNKAVEQLKQSISLCPTFVLALNELGVQYLKLTQLDKAADSLTAAIKLAPEEFAPRLNYGIVLLNQRNFAEAESQFRTALKKNDAVPTAHMYLGITLAVQRKVEEAEKELLIAIKSNSPETSLAHRYLAGVYLEKHDCQRAAEQVEIYLNLTPNAPDAVRLRTSINKCRGK